MNCAYHADQSAVAYCRTCGKALCANCTRPVRGVIYCEDCLGARMGAGAPAGSFAPPPIPPVPTPGAVPLPPYMPPAPTSGGPNPTVAGILGGVFPFGVGAVYTGQYAKGLAHLAIFALLIAGCNANSEAINAISGIGIAFFVVYQIIDAVRSARAIQAGLPPPDPYGLGATFGGGVKSDGVKGDGTKADAGKIPTGAIVLILLGVLFLLHTAGVFEVGFERIWPVFIMGLGVWLFTRNYGLMGAAYDPVTRRKRIMGPAMLFTIGALWLLSTFDRVDLSIGRTWPVILLVIGAIKLFERSGGDATLPPGPTGVTMPPQDVPPPAPPNPPAPPSTPSEVNHG